MSEAPPTKRHRSANYSCEEKSILLNLIFQEKHIIECKKTDAVTWRQKEESWRRITEKFNSIAPNETYRSMESLKKFYENQKKSVRKNVAEEKRSVKKTGGGFGYFIKDPTAELTLALMNEKTVVGLRNEFDSDCDNVDVNNENNIQNCDRANERESEEVITFINESADGENSSSQINNDNERDNANWSVYTPDKLKQPIHPKLRIISKISQVSGSTTTKLSQSLPSSSSSSRTTTAPSSSLPSLPSPPLLPQPPIPTVSQSWNQRRRPVSSVLSTSNITKQYEELSSVKLELATLELATFKSSHKKKEEREEIESHLRQKCMELDIEIKKLVLEKLKTVSPTELLLNYLREGSKK